jgi:hypothetical protein
MKYLTLLGCLIFLAVSSVQSSAQRARDLLNPKIAPPIKVTALPFNAGKSRAALRKANTWLTQPLVQVENTSTNVIEYLVIQVSFPGANIDPLMLAYGQTTGQKSSLKVGEPLQPGEKVSLSVSRNTCEELQSRLLASGVRPPSGSRVNTRINTVIFTNKTAWFDGYLHIADPNDPSRWNVVTKNSKNAELPLFQFMQTGYRVNFNPTQEPSGCYLRTNTVMIDCCGIQVAYAIMHCCSTGGRSWPFVYFCCDDSEVIMDIGCD